MAFAPHKPREAPKSSVSESAQSFIDRVDRKKAAADLQRKMAGTQEGVAEVMAGIEKPGEKISEKEGETGERRDIRGGGRKAGQTQAAYDPAGAFAFPVEEVMIRMIRKAIETEIEWHEHLARRLEDKIAHGGAAEYSRAISKIRELKDLLASLFSASVEYLKKLYAKYFSSDGSRKRVEEL